MRVGEARIDNEGSRVGERRNASKPPTDTYRLDHVTAAVGQRVMISTHSKEKTGAHRSR
jgi:hypothetical protein